jgi:hypothetical protein
MEDFLSVKKPTLFIYPFIIGLLSGGFIECCLCFLSIIISPFSGYNENRVLLFYGIISFLLALFLIVLVIWNVKQLIDLNSSKIKWVIVAQSCATILVMFMSWSLSSLILDTLYERFF